MICSARSGLIAYNDLDPFIGWITYVVGHFSHLRFSDWGYGMQGPACKESCEPTTKIGATELPFLVSALAEEEGRKSPSPSAWSVPEKAT
jgi:hypothetical protein